MTPAETAKARAAYEAARREEPWWAPWDDLPEVWRDVWLLIADRPPSAKVYPFPARP